MALDRFIYWNERRATPQQIEMLLHDYLGGIGELCWDKDRYYVTLPGKPTFPFKHLEPTMVGAIENAESQRERWIEIWFGDDCLDVITRQTDHFTNDIAKGLAEMIANYWEGRLES